MSKKTVFIKATPLHNVAGRIDYISNPDRQEHLLAFYDMADLNFWSDLAKYERQQGKFNAKSKVWEAREIIYAIPNEMASTYDMDALAKVITDAFYQEYGVKSCCGIHLNKAQNNLHAHLIFSERKILEQEKTSVATRNTYFDENGKRSTKKECTDENGELKDGCRLVLKGENLSNTQFSAKIVNFRNKKWLFQEKQRTAAFWNEYCFETEWEVFHNKTNPHFPLTRLQKGEAIEVRAEKEKVNALKKEYNEAIDSLIEQNIVLPEEAAGMKETVLSEAKQSSEEQIIKSAFESIGYLKKLQTLIKLEIERIKERLQRLAKGLPKQSLADIIAGANRKKEEQNSTREPSARSLSEPAL